MMNPRTLRRTHIAPRVRVSLLGDSATGKTAFLRSVTHALSAARTLDSPDISGTSYIPDCPTNGVAFAESSLHVSLDPRQPTTDPCSAITLTWREFGNGTLAKSFLNLQDRHAIGADSVGLFFSATSNESLEHLISKWRLVLARACANSRLVPFVFVVETHCDGLGDARLTRDRRILDIALRRLYGAQYMFFQIDATNASACTNVMQQIAVQARHQLLRPASPIHVIGNGDASRCSDVFEETRIGMAITDCLDSDTIYGCRVTCTQTWKSVRMWLARKLPWLCSMSYEDIETLLHEEAITLIYRGGYQLLAAALSLGGGARVIPLL